MNTLTYQYTKYTNFILLLHFEHCFNILFSFLIVFLILLLFYFLFIKKALLTLVYRKPARLLFSYANYYLLQPIPGGSFIIPPQLYEVLCLLIVCCIMMRSCPCRIWVVDTVQNRRLLII